TRNDIDTIINSKISEALAVIGSSEKKGLFGRKRKYINVYKYPGVSLVHSEKGKFIGCIVNDNDKIYILTKKG
ncbi:MAG: hypothetical protein K2J91_07005, partial [Lachnospiraceae bacterium]|nr:hypothetical protein [Lachnospiraceae bacterium]